jgi:carboxyl-terminal processing protease
MYYDDLEDRYYSGEMYNADSIKFNASAKFLTSKGRVVYGGGGIIPDVYVPLDTSAENQFINQLYDKNLIREFALNFANIHRSRLKKIGLENYINHFTLVKDELEDFAQMAKTAQIPDASNKVKSYSSRVQLQLKAFIARFVWYEMGFFPIINTDDPMFLKALQQFEKAEAMIETRP